MMWEVDKQQNFTIIRFKTKTITTGAASELKTVLLGLINGGDTKIIANLKEIERIDSSGLGALLFGQRQTSANDGWFRLAAVPEVVMNLLKIAMLEPVFEIFATEEEATESL